MRYLTLALIAISLLTLFVIINTQLSNAAESKPTPPTTNPAKEDPNMKKATFAAGCFWGVEEAFGHVKGVVSTRVGYIGGKKEKPTYREVCTDTTGHAEALEVTYDPAQVSYAELLDTFWTCHNPTTKDRQGPDVGSQYRSAIFTHDKEQAEIAKASKKEVDDSKIFKKPIVTEIVEAGTFWTAEEYHQQYFTKNGGVCHAGIAKVNTTLAKEAKKTRESTPTTQPTTQPATAQP
jgi:peptide-methionine (S)-S-oxide reductase